VHAPGAGEQKCAAAMLRWPAEWKFGVIGAVLGPREGVYWGSL
jgi:hypothetical protein